MIPSRNYHTRFNMALWQFHCYIIPMENKNLNEKSCDEDILSWKKHIIPTARIDF